MTNSAKLSAKADEKCASALDNLYQGFDAAVDLPAKISRKFLSAALLHLLESKANFGVFDGGDRILIGYDPGNDEDVPHRWLDGKWRIGRDPDEWDRNNWHDFDDVS